MITIYCDENQGYTYRAKDLRKWANDELKRHLQYELQEKKKTRAFSQIDQTHSESLVTDYAMDTETASDIKKATSSIQPECVSPNPIRPSAPFDKSRMNTVVIYGWKPWEQVIGKEGIIMADKMFSEFVQDPIQNVKGNDLKLLIPSLKIIMSSKLLGLDRYLESENDNGDLSYNDWLFLLFEKFRDIMPPDKNNLYKAAQDQQNKEKKSK